METARDLLRDRPHGLVTAAPAETVLDATRRMNEEHVGSVLVMDGDRLVGIFTERDVLRRVVGARLPPERTAVADVMTRAVISCPPDAPIDDVAELMRSRRIRHVPIIDAEGFVVGLVSIGDVNACRFSRCETTLHQVEDYLWRRA
ncbi:CBS domain-containing protein [bacterium]|nr:CBS domain-containing protein [bacterium]